MTFQRVLNPFAPELEIDGGKIILVVILSLKGPNSILSESRCPSYFLSLLIKMLLISNIGLQRDPPGSGGRGGGGKFLAETTRFTN